MTPIQLGIVLSLKDRASHALNAINQKLQMTKGASEELTRSMQEGGRLFLSGVGMMYGGAKLLTGALAQPLSAAASLEAEMAKVGTIAGTTAEGMIGLQREVERLSVRYGKSQEEMARGLYGTISAGITDAKEATKALNVAARMAAAGATETDTAISGLTSVLNAYHQSADEAINVSDAMFTAMKRGKTTMEVLAGSMGTWTGNAAALGVSYQDALSAIAAATLPGMSTQSAAQGMRGLLAAFEKPQKEAVEVARQYGLELSAAAIKTKGLYGVLQEVNKLPEDVIARIFTNIRTATFVRNAMSGEGQAFMSIAKEMQSAAGATDEAFSKIAATFKFKYEYMSSAVSNFTKRLGMPLLGPVGRIVEGFGRMFQWLGQLPAPIHAIISGLTAFVGVSLLTVGALAALAGATKLWGAAMEYAGIQRGLMKAQLLALGKAIAGIMSPLGAFIAAAGLAYLAWKNNWGGIRDTVEGVTAGIKMALSANENGIATVEKSVADRLKKLGVWEFAVTMGRAFYRVRRFGESFVAGVRTWVGWLTTFGKAAVKATEYIWSPIITAATKVLDVFGLLKNVSTDTASQFGVNFGTVAAALTTCYAAMKLWAVGAGAAKVVLSPLLGAWWLLGKAIALSRNKQVENVAAMVLSKGAAFASAAAAKTAAAAQWLWNAALTANPIGLIIAGVAALAVLAVVLYKKWKPFRDFCDKLWAGIKNGARNAVEWFKSLPARVIEWVKSVPSRIMATLSEWKGAFVSWFTDLWESVKPDFSSWFKWGGDGKPESPPVYDLRDICKRYYPDFVGLEGYSVPANAAQTAQAAAANAKPAVAERVVEIPRVQTDTSAALANRPANLGAQAQAQTQALTENRQEQPVRVENVTTVTPGKVYVNLDGREIGEATVEYIAQQAMLSGGLW